MTARLRQIALAAPKSPERPPVAMPKPPEAPPVVFVPSSGPKPLTATEERALKPKDTFKECADCPEMVVVPAGSFMMGSPRGERDRDANEGPQRRVTIARPFAVGKFEVMFVEWDACVAAGGCAHRPGDEGWGRGNRPVVNVSWHDVTGEYLPWLSLQDRKDLPPADRSRMGVRGAWREEYTVLVGLVDLAQPGQL